MKKIIVIIILSTFLISCNNSQDEELRNYIIDLERKVEEYEKSITSNSNNTKLIEEQDKEINELLQLSQALQISKDRLEEIIKIKVLSNLFNIITVEIDTSEYFQSTEGSFLEAKYNNDQVIKFKIHYFGEMGQKIENYYLINKTTYYIEVESINYLEPFQTDNAEILIESYYVESDIVYKCDINNFNLKEEFEIEKIDLIISTKKRVFEILAESE